MTAAEWLEQRAPRCMFCPPGSPIWTVCATCNPLGLRLSRYVWVHAADVEGELRTRGRHITGRELTPAEVLELRRAGWIVLGDLDATRALAPRSRDA